ncbi:MAG: hypothetical protein WB711_22160, partial [Terriglobales bacterium]
MERNYFNPKLAVAIAILAILGSVCSFSADDLSESPIELVRRTVQRETATGSGGTRAMFMDHKGTPQGSRTKLIVETSQGTAGMLVAIDNKALSPAQREGEEARLEALINNPDGLKKKQKSEKEDAEHVTRIMKALPDAFLYEPEGTVAGSEEIGKPGDQLIRLKFRPNPNYNPPSHTEQVLSGMQGYILIDANQHRIAKIDGTLTKEVGFGWGILGHLDRGGHFLVEQAEVILGDWEITHMSLSFTGKELLF